MENNYFIDLNNINVSDKTEKKNGLNYLSWAWAWGEVKKLHPTATYKVYERDTEYGQVNYFTDGKTCWVKTSVTINDLEHIDMLPVMDFKNKSIPLENVTSFDVNKTIQRSITKAVGRHGLGLYIYAGEDLPESEKDNDSDNENNNQKEKKKVTITQEVKNAMEDFKKYCENNGLEPNVEWKKANLDVSYSTEIDIKSAITSISMRLNNGNSN